MFKRFFGPAVVAATLGALALAGTAAAQTGNPLGCTAGTATATLGGQNLLPGTTIANPRVTPCANDQQLLNATPFNALGLVSGTLGPISAQTKLTTSTVGGSTVYTRATATSDVDAATISVGATPVAPGLTIGITTPSQAKVDYACVNNQLQTNYSSTLNAITIDGQTVPLTGLPQNLSSIPGVGSELSGIAEIEVNQHTSTASSDTETLLHVQLLGALDSGVTLDVGNATASTTQSSPCSGTSGSGGGGNGGGGGGGTGGGGGGGGGTGGGGGGGGGTGGGSGGSGGNGGSGSGFCPSGSTVAGANLCEIAAGTEDNSSAITFNGGNISGGSVISLALARKRYRSVCLKGAGPRYVVIGTQHADKITVSKVRERVLGLGGNDRITVKSGNHTCVDGGAGNDTIKAGKAPVLVYGGPGNNKITVGNGNDVVHGGGRRDVIRAGDGNDRLYGGRGNSRITAGNGNDRLYGGRGNDRLTAGRGRDYLFGGRGNNRLTARGKHAYLYGGSGHNVAYVRRANAKFARHHGCRKVHIL